MRATVITVSDRSSRGERPDASGPLLQALLAGIGAEVVEAVIVPDEVPRIATAMIRAADEGRCDLVLTTGGTGLSPRDVTPEATRQVIDRELLAMELALHRVSLEKTPFAMLSRGIAGVRGQTLIVNFPGSPKAVRECFAVIAPVFDHAVTVLQDQDPYLRVEHA